MALESYFDVLECKSHRSSPKFRALLLYLYSYNIYLDYHTVFQRIQRGRQLPTPVDFWIAGPRPGSPVGGPSAEVLSILVISLSLI